MAKKIGIDTPVFIYLLQQHKHYVGAARTIMQAVQSGEYLGVFSCIGIIEILTGPKKQGHYELAARYREMITHFPNLTIQGVTESIVETTSDLRARYGITTPDAIHLATAIDFGAEIFFTNDHSLTKVKEITVRLL
ncbi:PIN domain-containing protein [Candidatus Uhrbacteria bacterium]|nr:PIN domain-containing protein [Candidatus Uhrbacteria bacterium]